MPLIMAHYTNDVAAGVASGTAWLVICVTGIEFGRWLRQRANRTQAERVNDFAPPFVMNLLRKAVLISG